MSSLENAGSYEAPIKVYPMGLDLSLNEKLPKEFFDKIRGGSSLSEAAEGIFPVGKVDLKEGSITFVGGETQAPEGQAKPMIDQPLAVPENEAELERFAAQRVDSAIRHAFGLPNKLNSGDEYDSSFNSLEADIALTAKHNLSKKDLAEISKYFYSGGEARSKPEALLNLERSLLSQFTTISRLRRQNRSTN